ncbi:MAG: hypothetical protein HC792_05710 [Acaryochloridaceae cyanobacterium CSU_5_19]|nr:hypothetical protein [Acaryochloridaceae cyanobacterium CSU_5_19]
MESIKGYGHQIDTKIPIRPGVTFAGDVLNIGLGKIILLEQSSGSAKKLRLGIMADSGGAFLPNLHQLDFLAGIFPSHAEFQRQQPQVPAYADVYILIKKK